jgi:hypothetical protein
MKESWARRDDTGFGAGACGKAFEGKPGADAPGFS